MNQYKKYTSILATILIMFAFCFALLYFGIRVPNNQARDIDTPASDTVDELIIEDEKVPLSALPVIPEESMAETEASTEAQPEVHPYIQKVVELVNKERTAANLEPLEMRLDLNEAAGIRAEEIYTKFAHERPDGTRYRTVLDQLGISYSNCGENVAYGFATPKAVVDAWMNSEGHKANILNSDYTSIGVGYNKGANGYHYWAQMFAR